MRRLPASSLPLERPVRLDDATAHRVGRVLRLRSGAAVVLFDGDGNEVDAVLTAADGGWTAAATSAVRRVAAPSPLPLLFGVPKGAPLDNVLRMAVECGATHLHPLLTQRTVPKGDHADRWRRITEAAASQCGRADVPVIAPLRPLREAVAALPPGLDRRVGVPGAGAAGPAGPAGAWCVGPEGGLAPAELDLLLGAGFTPVALGPWVLRVDTAVVVGLAQWAARGGGDDENPPLP